MKISEGTPSIAHIDEQGFELHSRSKQEVYKWKDVKSIAFDKTHRKIVIKTGVLQKLILPNYYHNWYCLLRQVPSRFSEFDHAWVRRFFEQLQSCRICGHIAVHENNCCHCGNEAWGVELQEEYDSEQEYLLEEQLEHFATMDAYEDFAGFVHANPCFAFDSTWQPLISEEQVLAYSEEHYWA